MRTDGILSEGEPSERNPKEIVGLDGTMRLTSTNKSREAIRPLNNRKRASEDAHTRLNKDAGYTE